MVETVSDLPLQALRAGDRETFARFVDATSARIYRVILRILDNEQDAEDVLQETYLKAFRSLPDFEGRSNLTTWLYRIAVNEALMLLRRRKANSYSLDKPDDSADNDSSELEIIDFCCLPEGDLLSNEARQFLDAAVQQLPTGLKVVFIMRDIEGLSIQETAGALGLSESAVKVRLHRARLRLRQELSQYFGGRFSEEIRR